MPILSEKELAEFIKKERDENLSTWDQIAAKLKKMGHRSLRTKDFVTGMTVRHTYYYGRAGAKGKAASALPEAEASRKLNKIEAVVEDADLSDAHKLKMIRMLL